MANPVIMPRQGQSVESCIITKWFKQPGDAVAVGDVLFSYETDKAAFEEEAKEAGTLLAVFFSEGDDVPVLINVCAIGAAGEDATALDPNAGQAAQEGAQPVAAAPVAPAVETVVAFTPPPATEGTGEKISPRARALADRSGAMLSAARATGPEGRIIARDVQSLIDTGKVLTPTAAAAYQGQDAQGTGLGGRVTLTDLSQKSAPSAEGAPSPTTAPSAPAEDSYIEPMSRMRKTIAKSMAQSLSTMAQLTHNSSFDATQIQSVRKLFKEHGADMQMDKVTLNDIILYAVSRTLIKPEHRALNAHLIGDDMKYFRGVHLGMAVDTERGLMVPTIFNADRMTIQQISNTAKQLAKDCQAGTINPDFLTGASFTISNLGSLGIETFTPVINPPQTGILGVNTITTRVREVQGEIQAYPSMSLSLTYDHRALDGAPASRFLRDLTRNLENFTLLLAQG